MKGKYEMLRGNETSAEKWWQRAIAAAEKFGFLYDLGLAYLESGRLLNKRTHLEHASEIFSEIGAEWDLEQTQKALSEL